MRKEARGFKVLLDLHYRTVNALETTRNRVTCILRNAGLELGL
jgi:hypothetical protein